MAVLALAAYAGTVAGCRQAPPDSSIVATPVYNKETGRLEEIVSDKDGDGRVETRAFMDGTRIVRIEIDRNGDNTPDRREFYGVAADGTTTGAIERAEETDARGTVVREERYIGGVLVSVTEDTNADGRIDKWEHYDAGRLARVELDLTGAGRPTQRLTYGRDGGIARIESDRDGDGRFEPVTPQPATAEGASR